MKNKFSYYVFLIYVLIFVIFALKTEFLNSCNLVAVRNLFPKQENYALYARNLYYFEICFIYLTFGIVDTTVCLQTFLKFRQILFASILVALFIVCVVFVIKSYYVSFDWKALILALVSVFAGIAGEVLFKIRQAREGKQ